MFRFNCTTLRVREADSQDPIAGRTDDLRLEVSESGTEQYIVPDARTPTTAAFKPTQGSLSGSESDPNIEYSS